MNSAVSTARRRFSSAVNLAFTRYGNAEATDNKPLVIAHGLFGQKQNWNSVSKALQLRLKNQIFAVDMRNHGESPHVATMEYDEMAFDLVKFIETVVLPSTSEKFSSVHLLGHSMGGKAAMSLALSPKNSGLVDRLIVEDVSPNTMNKKSHSNFPYFIRAMKNADLSQSRKHIGQYLEPVVKDLATRQFLLTNLVSDDNGSRLKWKLNLDAIEEFLSHITSQTLTSGSFGGSALFQSGARSDYIAPQDYPVIKNLFPNATFDVIPDAGHWVHAEQPKLFIDSVVRFLGEKEEN